jgi:hypothetical protein
MIAKFRVLTHIIISDVVTTNPANGSEFFDTYEEAETFLKSHDFKYDNAKIEKVFVREALEKS